MPRFTSSSQNGEKGPWRHTDAYFFFILDLLIGEYDAYANKHPGQHWDPCKGYPELFAKQRELRVLGVVGYRSDARAFARLLSAPT